jgi:sterol desaturase/sphingolipid hydroxylase (fatty acid hydroxylase superfamily)
MTGEQFARAVPYVLSALMAIEYVANLARARGDQSPRDAATSVMVTVPHSLILGVVGSAWITLYGVIAAALPWQLPMAWWIWPVAILAVDLASYAMHRYHHLLNLTWGVHSVHHSSEEFTITTGARSSIAEPLVNVISGAYVILAVPALLGIPVEAAVVAWFVKVGWGVAVHTRCIDKLGPLEWVLATPSHHRVHHAINPIYRDKNFGFVTILWDKLFGTFQPELASEPPVFGTSNPPRSYHPLVAGFHELATVWRAAASTRRWRDKLRIWFMPAGWRPADVAADRAPSATFSPPPAGLYAIGGLQLAAFVVGSTQLTASVLDHGIAANVTYLGFLFASSLITGAYFEHSPSYPWLEGARAMVCATIVASTGTWFGRPIDGMSMIMLGLVAANLVASWLFAVRGRRRVPPVVAHTLTRGDRRTGRNYRSKVRPMRKNDSNVVGVPREIDRVSGIRVSSA